MFERRVIYNRKMNKWERITIGAFILGVIALFVEQSEAMSVVAGVLHFLDFIILGLILWSTVGEIRTARYPRKYIKTYWASIAFVALFTVFFLYSKYSVFFIPRSENFSGLTILIRNVFLLLKVLGRMHKVFKLFERMAARPAQTDRKSVV